MPQPSAPLIEPHQAMHAALEEMLHAVLAHGNSEEVQQYADAIAELCEDPEQLTHRLNGGAGQVQLSLADPDDGEDDADVEPIGSPEDLADEVVAQAVGAFSSLRVKVRKALLWALSKAPLVRALPVARQVLARHHVALESALTDARLAAALTAQRALARRVRTSAPPVIPSALPDTPWVRPPVEVGHDDHAPAPRLPLIEEAVADLRGRQVLTRPMFDQLEHAARQEAFTVAGTESEAIVEKVRDAVADAVETGKTLPEFVEQVRTTTGEGTFLSPMHAETVFRTNVMSAYSAGQQALLDNELVGELFPYAEYSAIRDDRVRPHHLALETYGIGGGPIYRRDDPVFTLFTPPWEWNCRCAWTPLSVRDAADKGVAEAIKWLRDKRPPEKPAHVKMPPFRPDPKFTGAELSAAEPEAPKRHEFSSTQFDLPEPLASRVKALAAIIPDDDLAEKGREETPHITCLYGLSTDDPETVREVASRFEPIAFRLGKASVFNSTEEGKPDVVWLSVESPGLHVLHAALAEALPHTDTHPNYFPHVTLAYVLPGRGEKIVSILNGVLDTLIFADRDGKRTPIPLSGMLQLSAAPDDGESDDDAHELASMYAGLWNALADVGVEVPEDEIAAADEELQGTDWHVDLDEEEGTWHVRHGSEIEDVIEMSAERAPKGGVSVGGKQYRGGMFIPSSVVANATPEEKAAIAGKPGEKEARDKKATDRTKAREAKGAPDRAKLTERLSAHAGQPLPKSEQRNAAASWRMLERHHGPLALHRVEELADLMEKGLAAAKTDGKRRFFKGQLARLHHISQSFATSVDKVNQPTYPDAGEKSVEVAPAAAAAAEKDVVKEPWQMTRDEYRKTLDKAPKVIAALDQAKKAKGKDKQFYKDKAEREISSAMTSHRVEVEVAQDLGRAVPPEVLADYPHLTAPKVATQAPAPVTQKQQKDTHEQTFPEFVGDDIPDESLRVQHRDAVKAAIASGKPVPPEVLADYPDISQSFATPVDKVSQPTYPDAGEKKPAEGAKMDVTEPKQTLGMTKDSERIFDKLVGHGVLSADDFEHPQYQELSKAVQEGRQAVYARAKQVSVAMKGLLDPADEQGLSGSDRSASAYLADLIDKSKSGNPLPNMGIHGDSNGKLIHPGRGIASSKPTGEVTKRAKRIAETTGRPVVPVLVKDSGGVPQGWAFIESPVDFPFGKSLDNSMLGSQFDMNGGAHFEATAWPKGFKAGGQLTYDDASDEGTHTAALRVLKNKFSLPVKQPAKAPPSKPAAPERLPATPQTAQHVAAKVAAEMLADPQFAGDEQVPIHALRQRIAEKYGPEMASHEVLDPALMALRLDDRLRMVAISDQSQATHKQLGDSVPGDNETFYSIAPEQRNGKRAVHVPPLPAPAKPTAPAPGAGADLRALRNKPELGTVEQFLRANGADGAAPGVIDSNRTAHRAAVEAAVAKGEKLAPAVLAEYPDLAPTGSSWDKAPPATKESAIARAAQEVKGKTSGLVKVPELIDRVRERFPDATPKEIQMSLRRLENEDKLTLQVVNDRSAEPRIGEAIESKRGPLGYVHVRPGSLADAAPAPAPAVHQSTLAAALDKHKGEHNHVSLAKLRSEAGLPREQFDAAMKALRTSGAIGLAASDKDTTKEQRDAAIRDDPTEAPLIFASVKDEAALRKAMGNSVSTGVDKPTGGAHNNSGGETRAPTGEKPVAQTQAVTIRKGSSSRRPADIYRQGNVIRHEGQFYVVMGTSTRGNDYGSYEHSIALRPANEAEQKTGRINEIDRELRDMSAGPSDDRDRPAHEARQRLLENEQRSLQGRQSVEEEHAQREAKQKEDFRKEWREGNIYNRMGHIQAVASRPDSPLHKNASWSKIGEVTGIDSGRLMSLADGDESAPEITGDEIERIAKAVGIGADQLRHGTGELPL